MSALQGLVSAGEFGENLRLIHGSSKSLARGIDNYLKGIGPFGRKVNAAKRLKILADRWLEYSFGWKPLINELDSAAHAVSNIVNYRMPTEQILAQGSTTENISSIKVQRSSGSGCRWECDSRTYWEFGFKLYGVVFLQHGTSPSSIQTNLGVTMSDFVPALWELIPYSFLVDYFTNVGSILSAWSFNTSNLAWHAQGSAVRLNCVSTVSFRDPLPGNVRLPTSVPGSPLHVARTYLTRLPGSLAGFVPSLGFKIPGIGSTKWLNIAALATGHSEAVKRASRM